MKTVVVLGAGSTRGASFAQDQICKPPLNTDFFVQLQKVRHSKHSEVVKKVIKDAFSLFGPNFSLTLEEFFTFVEGFTNIIKLLKKGTTNYRLDRINAIRKNLMQAIARGKEGQSLNVEKSKKTSVPLLNVRGSHFELLKESN